LRFVLLQTWSATEKDVKDTTVLEELPRLLRRFWPMLTFMTLLIVGGGIMTASFIPFQWQITNVFVQIPLFCIAAPHLLFTFVLNPQIVRLRF
jgi:hypothetical protein